jgi:hypothetical protein
MRRCFAYMWACTTIALAVCLVTQPSSAQQKSKYWGIASFTKYVTIPGGTRVGSEACAACHSEISNSYSHAFHAQQGIECKQLTQTYWGEPTYTAKQRLGLNLMVTYNSARSGYRPDLNPADAAQLGNSALIADGDCATTAPPCFDPIMFGAALNNLQFSSTQISQVIVPQWIGQSKGYYLFPMKFEGGLVFYYGSYRDELNPNLNGVLRTFSIYVGRSW